MTRTSTTSMTTTTKTASCQNEFYEFKGSAGTVIAPHTGLAGDWWMGGGIMEYALTLPSACAGVYVLSVTYARGWHGSGSQTAALGGSSKTYSLPFTGGWWKQNTLNVQHEFKLTPGAHKLRVTDNDGQNTKAFTLTRKATATTTTTTQ